MLGLRCPKSSVLRMGKSTLAVTCCSNSAICLNYRVSTIAAAHPEKHPLLGLGKRSKPTAAGKRYIPVSNQRPQPEDPLTPKNYGKR
jgi:hypothetical protein